MKLTLSEAAPYIADALGVCEANLTVCAKWANKAVRRLLPKGNWVGTWQRYRFCTTETCLTMPRQLETILAATVCDRPITLRTGWYEFVGTGPGQLSTTNFGSFNMVDKGEYVSFDDMDGTDKKIRVYWDVVEASSSYIILQGYDENGNWIRTLYGGNYIDGERIDYNATPQITTKKFTTLVGVIKTSDKGPVRLYEYSVTTAANTKQIAYYEPDETLPQFRRYYMPSLDLLTSEGEEEAQVEVAAKLRFIPVANANDYLMIGNVDAIGLAVQAIRKFDDDFFEEGLKYEALAVKSLQDELMAHIGNGAVPVLRVQHPYLFGAGAIENPC